VTSPSLLTVLGKIFAVRRYKKGEEAGGKGLDTSQNKHNLMGDIDDEETPWELTSGLLGQVAKQVV
jgi:hypothetical protein